MSSEGMDKFIKPQCENFCTHDRAAMAYFGAEEMLCGKSPSLSQTTKRHVVNKFSIKFKATQKRKKKDEAGNGKKNKRA